MNNFAQNTEADLAALADGSLVGDRLEEVIAEVHDSPELAAALAEQQRAVTLIRSVDVRAPDSVHQRIESLQIARQGRSFALRFTGHRPFFSRLGLAGAVVAAGIAVATIASSLGTSDSSALSLRQASALTLRAATTAAPPESRVHRTQLADAVDGVAFPYWEEHFGWRSTGTRIDRMGGRSITTVFYADNRGRRIGYAIVAGPALQASGGVLTWQSGIPYRLLAENGAVVVTWLRAGHSCVLSGRGVDAHTLLRLASWSDAQAVNS